WAVLMNGGHNSSNNHVRYWNDISNIYIALNSVYGFADDKIIVLCSDGRNPAPDQSNGQNSDPDLDGDGDEDINYPCVLAAIDAVFDSLSDILTESDKLFIFSTDHGSSDGGWSTHFNLWNEESLFDWHFAELLEALPQCEIICTFEPCYSGGFLDDVVVPPGPIVASSACRHDQVSWAMPPNYMYDTYVFHWTAAVKGEDAYGVPVNADYNGDGIVTMDEAFRYAEIHDTSNEDPQYSDYPLNVGAGLSLWPTSAGPFLTVAGAEIDDIGGNNNGAPDPGETISILITLFNVGNSGAANIVGTLSTIDPYLTVTQNISYFPDLAQFQQGVGSPQYEVDIDAACPQGYTASCVLHLEADSAYTNDLTVAFVVGDEIYLPSGPDNYGYFAYDPYDVPELPQYEWVEISADSGGLGTLIPFTQDDQAFQFPLPFTFQFYGLNYDTFSIGCNGWISMGVNNVDDYSNTGIPNIDGPSAMIAPYWEDLSPQRPNSGRVWRWFDSAGHRFIIEYNHVEQYAPTGSFETFQVILFDPEHYTTGTGDGQIMFQYKNISAAITTEGTIGIENHLQNDGLQYLFDGELDIHGNMIENQMALLFTTISTTPALIVSLEPAVTPIVIPANGGTFDFNIEITNNVSLMVNFDVWTMVTLPSGSAYGPLIGPVNLSFQPGFSANRDRTQAVPAGAPAGDYTYDAYAGNYPGTIWAEDHFDFEKSAVSDGGGSILTWNNWGEDFLSLTVENSAQIPDKPMLYNPYPNPFNPAANIQFGLNETAHTKLTVYNIMGQRVEVLIDGVKEAGHHSVTWNADGLPAGVYFVRIQAGEFSMIKKCILLK
ncbi:MAG: T9SS type A sorting domain-containing protein, partial [FCB group bacterium]|nr:T9SS type A sorting domain-containing protein [FCB group bacterium]